MPSAADEYDASTRLFAPRNARQLLAAHGGLLVCPARRSKAAAPVDDRAVIWTDLHVAGPPAVGDEAAQLNYRLKRDGNALLTLSPLYGPLVRVPTVSSMLTFLHRHQRHGTFDLEAVLALAAEQRVEEACAWLSRMLAAMMRCATLVMPGRNIQLGMNPMPVPVPLPPVQNPVTVPPVRDPVPLPLPPVWSPVPLPLPSVSAGTGTGFVQQVHHWVDEQCTNQWLPLIRDEVPLEQWTQLDQWADWQAKLEDLERFVERAAGAVEVRALMDENKRWLLDQIRNEHVRRCPDASGQGQARPEGDQVTLLPTTPIGLPFSSPDWPLTVRVAVERSFEELVLAPHQDTVVLMLRDMLRDPVLFWPLVCALHTFGQLLGSQRWRPSVVLFDTRIEKPDVNWFPRPCFQYWREFEHGSLVFYPAAPVDEQISFSDSGEQRRVDAYDWTWGGRILTHQYTNPDVYSTFEGSEWFPRVDRWVDNDVQLPSLAALCTWIHSQASAGAFDLQAVRAAA